jgi:NTE family protein
LEDDAPGALLDRCEREHDRVVLQASDVGDAWTRFCLRQADRTIALVDAETPDPPAELRADLQGCELVLCGPGWHAARLAPWLDAIHPRRHHLAKLDEAAATTARRLLGTSVGLVLSGGGARALAHIGVLDELAAAGVTIDRIAGCSMGAFVGALYAAGHDVGTIRAHCERELVRRRPLDDYAVPRVALLRGRNAHAMLERTFGRSSVEELPRAFCCVSCDLVAADLVVHRRGPLVDALAASMCVPGLLPPQPHAGRLLVDGGVMSNLPVEQLAAADGPIIAVDVTQTFARPLGLPRITETLLRTAVLGSAREAEAAKRRADVCITPRVGGVGLLEFGRLESMVQAGRAAARAALEKAPALRPG